MNNAASLVIHSKAPFNAEPPPELLRAQFVTPRELFFVRNHGALPEIEPDSCRLRVEGLVERTLDLSLDRLRNDFAKRTVMATLECAGNRRIELIAIAPTPGETPWHAGAIGNAFWGGAPLKEVLNTAGLKTGARYVELLGLDDVERGSENVGFGGSITLDKALSAEVLLAYEMNGQPLTPEHGFPLRVITPGYIGARSVKWLSHIVVRAGPSQNYFQAHAYQLFPPQTNNETADWRSGLQLSELAVNSVICVPENGATVGAECKVQGYAISGGGRGIARVDVSSDGGATWTTAQLTQSDQPWAWTFWEVGLKLAPGEHELSVRAFDIAANTQPEDARQIWNFKGYVNNAWHRIKLRVSG